MIIATVAPYINHRQTIIEHPLVSELRFNTIMPIGEERQQVVHNLLEASGTKPLWLDLKTRQLRISKFAYLPYSYIEISHKISVNLPAKIYFKDCVGEIVRIIDGKKLILADRPRRVVGEGEPINILDSSLNIDGFLTDSDREYISAAKSLSLHNYMLSFVEDETDIDEIVQNDPNAKIIAKIESIKGLKFVEQHFNKYKGFVRLMAARDDLFINFGEDKFAIFDALKLIIERDPTAICASRILTSLEKEENVALGDLMDLSVMKSFGYNNIMLSDGICFSNKSFKSSIAILERFKQFFT